MQITLPNSITNSLAKRENALLTS